MSNTVKIIIVAALALTIILVVVIKQITSPSSVVQDNVDSPANTNNIENSPNSLSSTPQARAIPRLVDVGAKKCIPCKMMAPILEELKKEYAGRLQVDFLDLTINTDYAGQYGVRVIPTQIFYDASGKELFRHEGFYSKEDILAKFKELGIELKAK